MINKRNKAVLSCKLDNTAKRICKHQESIMPTFNRMALHRISFSDFGERPAQRFSNVNVDSERVLSFDRDLIRSVKYAHLKRNSNECHS